MDTLRASFRKIYRSLSQLRFLTNRPKAIFRLFLAVDHVFPNKKKSIVPGAQRLYRKTRATTFCK